MNILSFDNNDGVGVCGTSLMGKVRTTYDTLVEKFGEPTYDISDSADGKVCAEWTLEFIVEIEDQYEIYEDCITATVYAWKEASIPYGEYDWHIGGHDFTAVDCVEKVLAA